MILSMLRRYPWRIVALVLLALIVFLPLRLAIGMAGPGVTARAATGIVWSGRLDQARIGGMDVGTVDVGLAPLSLLLGRARFAFARAGGDGVQPLSGAIETGLGGRAVDGLTGTMLGGSIGGLDLDRVAFDGFTARFAGGACTLAAGRVTIVPAIDLPGLNLANGLSGAARCNGRALELPLVGQSGMERLTLTLLPDGSYSAKVAVQGNDPTLATGLAATGFVSDGASFVRTWRGQIQ